MKLSKLSKQVGFTLLELMIVIAIVAILVTIALPAYNRYFFRARRVEGKDFLLQVAAAEERYFTNFNQYVGTTAALGYPSGTSQPNGYYLVTVTAFAGGTFSLQAVPQLVQATDACGTLFINSLGTKTWSGSETNGKCF
jgi:type IV pilus assembly protein PilE